MSDVPLSEPVAELLRRKAVLTTDPQSIDFFRLVFPAGNLVLHEKSIAHADPGWPDFDHNDMCFIGFRDVNNGQYKIVLWYPPDGLNHGNYYDAKAALAPYTAAGTIPHIYQQNFAELNNHVDLEQRTALQDPAGPRRRTAEPALAELLEFQPAELSEVITDRRHRRFCNLLWVQQEDKTFALERCETDQEYAADGSIVDVGQGANPAPLIHGLQDHVGMHMHPDGAGFVLPEPDWEALWEEEQAYWDQETPQTPQQRTWQSGLHTDRSERNYNKVNAQARLSLDRPGHDSDKWTVSLSIGADTFYWAGAWIFGSWQPEDHDYTCGAAIYTQADWNRKWAVKVDPIATIGNRGRSSGTIGIASTFSTDLAVDSGIHICTWWYHRGSPDTGSRFQQDGVTVSGDIVITTSPQ
ncbi:hypothetical protein [Streptomyces sp. NPDC051546]|uniref:hypothetical protein n=1 Tax=Streptomyces sp. NPDC051546 TaxID=3365655 RepID=UPI0037B3FAAC